MTQARPESWKQRLRDSAASLRARITLAATLSVAVGLTLAGFGLVALQRDALADNVNATVRLRADDIARLLATGAVPESVTTSDDEVALVQVLDSGGALIAASPNIRGLPPVLGERPAPGHSTMRTLDLPLDATPFRVRAQTITTPSGVYTLFVAGSLEDVNESAALLASTLRVGIPILVLLVGAGTWLLVGRALGPVERIRREVAAITEKDLSRRVPEPKANDEIGRLARTMNAMLARLEEAHTRQEQFVADAAHELRSPLASVRTQIEATPAADAPASQRDGEVLAEVLRMQQLIDGLLILAARDKPGDGPAPRAVDFDDVVLDELRLHPAPGIAIDASGVSAAAVRASPDQLRRIARNLIENGVRHARSSLLVSLADVDGVVTFGVEDDGEGIPAADRERVFERFVRLDSPRSRDAGGAGLGLAITRALVEGLGGTVRVEDGANGGARVVVRLPNQSRDR